MTRVFLIGGICKKNDFFPKYIMFSRLISRSLRQISTVSADNHVEKLYTSFDYPLDKCMSILKDEQITVVGYGPQGRGQALNLRDNGFKLIWVYDLTETVGTKPRGISGSQM